jgi:hypothetical protein
MGFFGGAVRPHLSPDSLYHTLEIETVFSHEHQVAEKHYLSEDHNLVPIAEADDTKVSASRGSSTKEGLQQEVSDGLLFFFDWQCLSLTGDGVNRPSETSGEVRSLPASLISKVRARCLDRSSDGILPFLRRVDGVDLYE